MRVLPAIHLHHRERRKKCMCIPSFPHSSTLSAAVPLQRSNDKLIRMAIFNNFNRYGPPCWSPSHATFHKSDPDEARKQPSAYQQDIRVYTPGIIRTLSYARKRCLVDTKDKSPNIERFVNTNLYSVSHLRLNVTRNLLYMNDFV